MIGNPKIRADLIILPWYPYINVHSGFFARSALWIFFHILKFDPRPRYFLQGPKNTCDIAKKKLKVPTDISSTFFIDFAPGTCKIEVKLDFGAFWHQVFQGSPHSKYRKICFVTIFSVLSFFSQYHVEILFIFRIFVGGFRLTSRALWFCKSHHGNHEYNLLN